MFELNNFQRQYLGLEPIEKHLDRVIFNDKCILYYDENVIKRIITTDKTHYLEIQCHAQTENRQLLCAKTSRGKNKKITFSVIEKIPAEGVFFHWVATQFAHEILIKNATSLHEYYSTFIEDIKVHSIVELEVWIDNFIKQSDDDHLKQLAQFKQQKRQHIKYKPGDFFAFKLNRKEYGFGRILMDITDTIKKCALHETHEFHSLMCRPLLLKIYHYTSNTLDVDLNFLKEQQALPSSYVMDNAIYYGRDKIIGHLPLELQEIDFPISYSACTRTNRTYLQWGLMHLSIPSEQFKKYTLMDREFIEKYQQEHELPSYAMHPLFTYSLVYSSSKVTLSTLLECISSGSNETYWSRGYACGLFDLRNPKLDKIRKEIFKEFNLNSVKELIK